MHSQIIRCTLSGSFRKDIDGLQSAYCELVTNGCQVLSPHRLNFDNLKELFVKDAAETSLAEDAIERHHLLSIAQSDFLWLHAPGGYIGASTAFEIGYSVSRAIPVFCSTIPTESVFVPYIHIVPSVYKAIESLR